MEDGVPDSVSPLSLLPSSSCADCTEARHLRGVLQTGALDGAEESRGRFTRRAAKVGREQRIVE